MIFTIDTIFYLLRRLVVILLKRIYSNDLRRRLIDLLLLSRENDALSKYVKKMCDGIHHLGSLLSHDS